MHGCTWVSVGDLELDLDSLRCSFLYSHCHCVKNFKFLSQIVVRYQIRDLPNPTPIFSVGIAFTWHYLWRNQFHLVKYFYLSSFLQLCTAKFQICLIILKKWMYFCLPFEALLGHFLPVLYVYTTADEFLKLIQLTQWAAESWIETEYLPTLSSQAKKKVRTSAVQLLKERLIQKFLAHKQSDNE